MQFVKLLHLERTKISESKYIGKKCHSHVRCEHKYTKVTAWRHFVWTQANTLYEVKKPNTELQQMLIGIQNLLPSRWKINDRSFIFKLM